MAMMKTRDFLLMQIRTAARMTVACEYKGEMVAGLSTAAPSDVWHVLGVVFELLKHNVRPESVLARGYLLHFTGDAPCLVMLYLGIERIGFFNEDYLLLMRDMLVKDIGRSDRRGGLSNVNIGDTLLHRQSMLNSERDIARERAFQAVIKRARSVKSVSLFFDFCKGATT